MGQGPGLHRGARLELEDDARAARGAPALAGQRVPFGVPMRAAVPISRRASTVDRRGELRGRLSPGIVVGGRRLGQSRLGRLKGRFGTGQVLIGVVDEADEGRRCVPALEDGFHGGAEGAHMRPMSCPHALLSRSQRLAVEIDGVAIAGHIPGDVLHDEARLPERCGEGRQRLVGTRGLLDERDGRVQGVQRPAVAGERLGGSVGVAGEHLGVLGPGEPVACFLVLAALRVHRLYLLQREAGLLQLGVEALAVARSFSRAASAARASASALAKRPPLRCFPDRPNHRGCGCAPPASAAIGTRAVRRAPPKAPHCARARHAGHGSVDGGATAPVGADPSTATSSSAVGSEGNRRPRTSAFFAPSRT